MPRPVNLTGHRAGCLKAIRLDQNKHNQGGRWWVCRCDCGHPNVVRSASYLGHLHPKSCGPACPLRNGRAAPAGSWRPGEVSAKYEANVVIQRGGRTYYAPAKAAQYVGVEAQTLLRWQPTCPDLDGEELLVIIEKDGLGRNRTYYDKESLDRLKKARATRKPVLKEDPEVMHVDDAMKRLGVSRMTLHRLLKKFCFKFEWKAGKGKKGGREGKSRDDKPRRRCRRSYVKVAFVKVVEATRAGTADRVTISDAATILGVSVGAVSKLISRKVLVPLPPLPTDDRRSTSLSRSVVEALRKKRDEAEIARLAPAAGKSLKALSATHHMSVWTLGELLRRWVKDGKLSPPQESERREANARRSRSRVLLYDTKEVAHLLRQRRAGVRVKDVVPLFAAPPAPTPNETSFPDSNNKTSPQRGGRPSTTGRTAEVKACCWEGYVDGDKLPVIRERCRRLFGEAAAPKQDSHVIMYAKRYAKGNQLPVPRHGERKTPEK
jgi:hypothetical protein